MVFQIEICYAAESGKYHQSLRISSRSPPRILQLTENENTAQIVALLRCIFHI